jgi:hypothetical protein
MLRLNLWIHEDEPEDLLVNGELLSEIKGGDAFKVGDIVEIMQPDAKTNLGPTVLLQIGSLSKISSKQRAQISISK